VLVDSSLDEVLEPKPSRAIVLLVLVVRGLDHWNLRDDHDRVGCGEA
jgi:hypothetical protein